eukprot:CAMPEP_0204377068 /NCGR_PEP_ID=MMETSP0469-20131031/50606_1 /ASSEMBLY_ACC=CAM_ASM_000384 /TAXON_ID=2969 /ORGANISM="Oxyrrhis marina" /LENGTH=48 /DNA_ID= /DNA_START= /DNA_END= /DNA_ORIENTATION=
MEEIVDLAPAWKLTAERLKLPVTGIHLKKDPTTLQIPNASSSCRGSTS